MHRLNLGVIGTGLAAQVLHWPALEQLSHRYRVVAVTNRTRSKGEAFADLIGLDRSSVYGDYREMLARDDIDVVDLTLPPWMNAEVAQAAAEAGIHVICEKPISITIEAAQGISALPGTYGIRVLVAENFRYENSIQRARHLIEEGAIAPPFMISYQWMQPVPPDDGIAARPWRQEPRHAGGFLSDHGVHMIDAVRYLMGDVAAVQAFGSDRRDFLTGLDNAVYSLQFVSGAIGSIQWSFTVASELAWRIQLWSDDGTLTVGPQQLTLHRQGQPPEAFAVTGPSSFVNEFEDFYQAIVNDRPPQMTVQDGIDDLRTVLAAHRSIVDREVVFLDKPS